MKSKREPPCAVRMKHRYGPGNGTTGAKTLKFDPGFPGAPTVKAPGYTKKKA